MQRLLNGQPIRDAMAAAGMKIPQLAEATRKADPEGKGLPQSLVGFIVTEAPSARERCTPRSAELVALALDASVEEFFTEDPPSSRTPAPTTTTVERRNSAVEAPRLPKTYLTQRELQAHLRRSKWWVDQAIKQGLPMENHARPGAARKSRRFDLAAVMGWLETTNENATAA